MSKGELVTLYDGCEEGKPQIVITLRNALQGKEILVNYDQDLQTAQAVVEVDEVTGELSPFMAYILMAKVKELISFETPSDEEMFLITLTRSITENLS